MRVRRICLLTVSIALLLAARCPAQGKLSQVRDTLTAPSSSEPESHESRDHDDHCGDDDDGGFFADVFGPVLLEGAFYVLSAPFTVPYAVLEEGQDAPRVETDFSASPYAGGYDGYLLFNEFERETPREDGWGVRLVSEYGTDFGGLDRYGGRLLVETAPRLGVDTEWNLWHEDLGTTTDELWTGDFNLIYRFAESQHAQFRAGLGVNWLSDDVIGDKSGFNFTYGFDLFPAEPFVLETTLDVGRISDSAYVHVRSTAGIVYRHVELFAGYDFRRIDDVELSGLVGGLTLWW